MSKTRANGQGPRPTKWVHFRAPVRGPMGESLTKLDDTIAQWSWSKAAPLLEILFFGSPEGMANATKAIEEHGRAEVTMLEVPLENIANFASVTMLAKQSAIVAPTPGLIQKLGH